MTLDQYLTERGLTNVAFAATVGADHSTISRLRKGDQIPSRQLAAVIMEATDGAVQPNDF